MSVQTQIDRLTKAKSDLKVSITNKGVAVSDDALISDYPALVDSIQTGGKINVSDGWSFAYSSINQDMIDRLDFTGVDDFYYKFYNANFSSNVTFTGLSARKMTYCFAAASGNILELKNFNYTGSSNETPFNYCKIKNLVLTNAKLSSCKSFFSLNNYNNVETITLNGVDTSNVIDFSNCFLFFYGTCGDYNSLNTSSAVNFTSMFYNCVLDETIDLSSWNTSKVTNMSYMFSINYNSVQSSTKDRLKTLDLSNWNTSNVTNMNDIFKGRELLTTVKVINCNDATKQLILNQLQTDLSSHTWTLGEDGIITRS